MADFNWYRNFLAVYRAGSVSGAARQRNLTQPAVSQQLAALESSVGEALFVRTPRGMQPTERGNALYTQTVESLDRLERISRGLKRDITPRPLRLGTSPEYFQHGVLPRIAGSTMRLQVHFGEFRELHAQLELGALDVVIGTQRPNSKSIETRALSEKRFYLVGAGHLRPPAAERSAWLRAQDWVSYGADLPLIRRFWTAQLGSRFDGALKLTVPDLRAVRDAVSLGMGVSILPDFLCQSALETNALQQLYPSAEVAPIERWLMAYREIDADRPELSELRQALLEQPAFEVGAARNA